MEVGPERFEELVVEALDSLPDALLDAMENVAVTIEATSPDPGLLGLYHGIPLTERGAGYDFVAPDRITIYRQPILAMSADAAEVVEQVRITVVHEIAHHFGIDDDRLTELGWD